MISIGKTIDITTEPVSRKLRPFCGARHAKIGRLRLTIVWVGRLSIIRMK